MSGSTGGRRDGRGRGGRDGHEPRGRIRSRELRAMELSNQGYSQSQIAAALGITQPAVSKMVRRIEERAFEEFATVLARRKARHTLRLDHIYAEAMAAWERSKADATRRRQRKTVGGSTGTATVAELVVENEHGDPRYLEEARKALADASKLWGLDAPQPIDIQPIPEIDLSSWTIEELHQRALALVEQTRQLMSTTVPTSLPELGQTDPE
jgi:predicted transcriptional regulator